jgi:hypothetical protein
MVYLLKIHGLSGFYYFFNRPNARECWEVMMRLGEELKVVGPLLLGSEPERRLRVFLANIHATTAVHDGRRYLIVAHAAPEPCSFALPLNAWDEKAGSIRRATVLFEDRQVPIVSGIGVRIGASSYSLKGPDHLFLRLSPLPIPS